jgi:hypothetical protein
MLLVVVALGCSSGAHVTTIELTAPSAAPPAVSVAAPPIANTTVEDAPDTRAILAVCERYRKALEARDVDTLVALASRRYLDHGIDFAALAAFVRKTVGAAIAIRYDIRYDDVSRTIDRVLVDFHYSASFELTDGKWTHTTSTSRLVLVREEGQYRILSGM